MPGPFLNTSPEPACTLAILSGGAFFMTALLTGVWKWREIMASPQHQAHPYVDIAHRASLMYSFAALLLGQFATLSAWDARVDLVATTLPLFYFSVAIMTYIWHGARRDTENQFAERNFISTWGMWLLVFAEVGGFAVLFAGVIVALLS